VTLSPKHIQVRDYVLSYQTQYGHKPKWIEIMEACGIRSRCTLAKYFSRLEKANELKLEFVQPQKAKAAEA
jgi:hypothetical protein